MLYCRLHWPVIKKVVNLDSIIDFKVIYKFYIVLCYALYSKQEGRAW
jgi:hypothetical protein